MCILAYLTLGDGGIRRGMDGYGITEGSQGIALLIHSKSNSARVCSKSAVTTLEWLTTTCEVFQETDSMLLTTGLQKVDQYFSNWERPSIN